MIHIAYGSLGFCSVIVCDLEFWWFFFFFFFFVYWGLKYMPHK
jgi:hypothetical protein